MHTQQQELASIITYTARAFKDMEGNELWILDITNEYGENIHSVSGYSKEDAIKELNRRYPAPEYEAMEKTHA